MTHGRDPLLIISAGAQHEHSAVFTPDPIIVSRARRPRTPELRLVAAVLDTALEDLSCAHPDATWKRRAARRWLCSTATDPWSFAWTCDLLGLDPDAVRRALK